MSIELSERPRKIGLFHVWGIRRDGDAHYRLVRGSLNYPEDVGKLFDYILQSLLKKGYKPAEEHRWLDHVGECIEVMTDNGRVYIHPYELGVRVFRQSDFDLVNLSHYRDFLVQLESTLRKFPRNSKRSLQRMG